MLNERLKVVGVKLRPMTIEAIRKLAAEKKWSLSQYLRELIERHARRAA